MATMSPNTLDNNLTTGGTNSQGLASWAAPYVTDMLGKAKAAAGEGYQTYKGPLTAGESDIQSNLFKGIGSLTFPGNLGKSFSSTGSYQLPTYGANGQITNNYPLQKNSEGYVGIGDLEQKQFANQGSNGYGDFGPSMVDPNEMVGFGGQFGGFDEHGELKPAPDTSRTIYGGSAVFNPNEVVSFGGKNEKFENTTQPSQKPTQQPQDIASQYMNPYLMSVLNPQLEELRRQSQITQMGNNAKLVGAGAFGGSRQAIMDAETQRNLMQEQNKTVGQGYANAYDKAMGQFNTEQNQAKTIADLMASTGATQRGITSEGIAADKSEFEKQREYPKTQLEFQQKMLSGLPIAAVTNTPGQMSDIGSLLAGVGGLGAIATQAGYKDVASLLKDLFGDT